MFVVNRQLLVFGPLFSKIELFSFVLKFKNQNPRLPFIPLYFLCHPLTHVTTLASPLDSPKLTQLCTNFVLVFCGLFFVLYKPCQE